MTGSVGYIHAVFDEFEGPSELTNDEIINRAGESFNNVPEISSYLSVEYSIPVDIEGPRWLRGWLTPRLDWYSQSEVHFLAPEVKEAYQRPYDVFGARLSYDFADDRAQVALWARNLTDTEYFSKVQSLVPIFGVLSRYYQAPRTFGAEITCQF